MRMVFRFDLVLPRQPQGLGNQLEAMPAFPEGSTRFAGCIMLYHFK